MHAILDFGVNLHSDCTGCMFPPSRRKLKLSQPQFADARDYRARTAFFRFRLLTFGRGV